MSKQHLFRPPRRAGVGVFLAAGVERFKQLISPHRAGFSTRIRAIEAAAATTCIMLVFEAGKQTLYPRTSIWASHILTILFTTLAAAVVTFAVLKKEAESEVRRSEIQYRLLFDSNPVPMWVFDRKTLKFLAVNEAASRQYGFSSTEFLTMTIADIRPEEDIPDLLEASPEHTKISALCDP